MLKNPFAVKDGKIICIADLPISERGLKCKCKCIACEAPLIARMGKINEHHFAHSEKLCDEGQAYIQGMYQITKEILDTDKYITLPGVKVAYQHSITTPITMDNIAQFIKLVSTETKQQEHMKYIVLFDKMTIPIDETYIKYKHNKNIEALIVKSNAKELAIKIALPPTICKDYKSKQVKDLSTLEIDFMDDDYELNTLTRKELAQMIISDVFNKRWISNLKTTRVYKRIIEENEKYIEEYKQAQEKMRAKKRAWQEEQRKIRQQELNNSLNIKYKTIIPSITPIKLPPVPTNKQKEEGYKEIIEVFDKESTDVIIDSYGNRWVYCTLCHKVKHVDEMGIYGGIKPNIGKCNQCFR